MYLAAGTLGVHQVRVAVAEDLRVPLAVFGRGLLVAGRRVVLLEQESAADGLLNT